MVLICDINSILNVKEFCNPIMIVKELKYFFIMNRKQQLKINFQAAAERCFLKRGLINLFFKNNFLKNLVTSFEKYLLRYSFFVTMQILKPRYGPNFTSTFLLNTVAFLAAFSVQKSPLIWCPSRIVILNKPFRNIPSSLPVSAYTLQFYWKMNTCVFQLSNELGLNLFIINLARN